MITKRQPITLYSNREHVEALRLAAGFVLMCAEGTGIKPDWLTPEAFDSLKNAAAHLDVAIRHADRRAERRA
jgi:hypothetical protein